MSKCKNEDLVDSFTDLCSKVTFCKNILRDKVFYNRFLRVVVKVVAVASYHKDPDRGENKHDHNLDFQPDNYELDRIFLRTNQRGLKEAFAVEEEEVENEWEEEHD